MATTTTYPAPALVCDLAGLAVVNTQLDLTRAATRGDQSPIVGAACAEVTPDDFLIPNVLRGHKRDG